MIIILPFKFVYREAKSQANDDWTSNERIIHSVSQAIPSCDHVPNPNQSTCPAAMLQLFWICYFFLPHLMQFKFAKKNVFVPKKNVKNEEIDLN